MPVSRARIKLPVKRVVGKTLRERLTANVYERILPARYLLRDKEGRIIETPEQMFRRVADHVAQVEAEYGHDPRKVADAFYEAMVSLEFMPNSPTLMNAGGRLGQLAACFVLSPQDNLHSIFDTLRRAALILQTGGGVGYTFSRLRPKGDIVQSTGGKSSGPLSFMHVYDEMCAALKQGGKRRGAQMAILRVDHPDIGRFIVAKRREGVLSNFNLSVAITDAFIEAVRRDERYTLYNPRTGEPFRVAQETAHFYNLEYEHAPYTLVEENFWRDYAPSIQGVERFRGRTELAVGEPMELPARFIWEVLVDGAWRNGEPGLFAIDEANRDHSFDVQAHPEHRIEATNPCGEQPLEEYEACGLGHINLSLLVADDSPLWGEQKEDGRPLSQRMGEFLRKAVDWERLGCLVRLGTRFLDDAVSMSAFPLAEIEEKQKGLRNIGLGIMGWAEMLIQLGIVYGSEASFEAARQIMAFINRESKLASHELAKERGVFKGWEDSKYAQPAKYADWFRRHTGLEPREWPDGLPLRNHHTTTVAPTGTTSMIADTSSGCEPLFDIAYFKNVGEDIQGQEPLVEWNSYFLQVLKANDLDVERIKEEVQKALHDGTFRGLQSLPIPGEIAELFITTDRIAAEAHVYMQAAFQKHVDSAISKTINLPRRATHEDVDRAYMLALQLGCKGLTVYRLGSREEEVLSSSRRASHGRERVLEVIEQEYGSLERFMEAMHGQHLPLCPECGTAFRGAITCPICGHAR